MKLNSARQAWRPVSGFEATHEVSDSGEVRSLDKHVVDSLGRKRRIRGRLLRPTMKSNGYLHLTLCGENGQRTLHLHRIVLEAFIGVCPAGMEALHRDGDQANNKLENLRWGTHLDNCLDRSRHGSSGHVLDIERAGQIRSLRGSMKQAEIAALFGVSQSLVSQIHRGKIWNSQGVEA